MSTRTLQNSPMLPLLYARAAATLIPGSGMLPGIAGGGGSMPSIELKLPNVASGAEALRSYRHVCGFQESDFLPCTFPHILAFPLHMAVMTDSGFPYSPIGLVHIENEIVQFRPIGGDELLDLQVSVGEPVAHPRGRAFELFTKVSAGDSLVWEERSKMLRRGSGGAPADAKDQPADGRSQAAPAPDSGTQQGAAGGEDGALSEEWHLAGDLGRCYAGVSGDRNPIHLHPLSARIFGFPKPIAHGMWTLARSAAALQQQLPESFALSIRFRKPVLLPADVCFRSQRSAGRIDFSLTSRDGRHSHLEGTVNER